jgi:ribosomal protein S18 acetylase RimI-like enzyme
VEDEPQEWRRGEYVVSTDRSRLDRSAVLAILLETHWADALTDVQLERAIAHSVCFGVSRGLALVGFGRVVTDLATYGYLTDVVVAPAHRGQGLGRWLTDCMVSHPQLQAFRRLALLTRDAESLYRRAGFTVGAGSLVYMERRDSPPPPSTAAEAQ